MPTDPERADDTALPLPLEGIRVLDATHIVAGPFCSLILADMGAEVIKIERPRTGDLARGRGPFIGDADTGKISSRFLGVNRNKKSVTLDLRNATCKVAFENLVANSDVLLDNWGPGAFRRLGFGYDRLREINPRLIYAEITGYGDGDGDSAMSGWMDITGAPGGTPQAVGDNMGDSVPGVWAALGIVLALETRRQTGFGQHVDVAMYECMASHVISNMNAYQATGNTPGRTRQASLGPGLVFRAADGYVVMAGVRSPQRLAALWELVEHPELPQQDPRYLEQFPDADFVFDEVIPAIETWSSQRPKWEVAGRLTEIGFSMGVAQSIADLADCPQLEARDMYVETADTLGGTFRSLATPIQLTACRPSATGTPPTLGQHNSDILCTLGGLTPEQLAELEAEGAV
ncbi:Succinyl-CoA:mesaconate CoA-transferase [Geodia barretti]|uniref:Succinyl-CoA:mesaconate CoA-transferase n=1 Tax=Geodia barretti TaxID=519541 RepID=A0AA35U1C1_GEOBA|nr:Succinyl-CoA:mesaconate CoA-transferase [Geodia barretti]